MKEQDYFLFKNITIKKKIDKYIDKQETSERESEKNRRMIN